MNLDKVKPSKNIQDARRRPGVHKKDYGTDFNLTEENKTPDGFAMPKATLPYRKPIDAQKAQQVVETERDKLRKTRIIPTTQRVSLLRRKLNRSKRS